LNISSRGATYGGINDARNHTENEKGRKIGPLSEIKKGRETREFPWW